MYEKLVEILAFKVPWKRIFKRRKRFLMIVENNPHDAEFLKALITTFGQRCEVVDSGEAALSLIEHKPHRYPIVFVDLRLGVMGGLTLIRKIYQTAPKAHIVACVGLMDDLLDLEPGLYIGLISKPLTAGAVRSVIEKTRL